MARHCKVLLFMIFLLNDYNLVESTASEKSPQVLLKPTGRQLTERSFLSSRTANSEQVNVGMIENNAVTSGKSRTISGHDVIDEDSVESESDSADGKQERNNFDTVLRSFEARVKKLEKKLRRESNISLYSSEEKQSNVSAVVENKSVSTTVDRPSSVISQVSTKTFELVTRSSVKEKAEIFSTQEISSTASSAAKREILPTPASSLHIIQQTAGVPKPTEASSVTATVKAITPSPSISVLTVDGNIFPTKSLSVSPTLEVIRSLDSESFKPHSATASSHIETSVSEGEPTAGPTLSTKHATENTELVLAITEISSTKPTEKLARSGKTGLFRNLSIEILIALVAGALCALLLVAFLVYRLKKRNEGSYDLSETLYMKIRTKDELGMKKEVFV